jgi:taurine dioxygenase
MNIQQLTPNIGAEIEGIDLNGLVDHAALSQIHNALLQHHVLFFRQQFLEPKAQRNLAAQFGDLHIHPIYPPHPDAAEIMVLDSHQQDLRDNELWHTDVTFIETPPLGCVLSAQKVPDYGGDTLWVSAAAAYRDLSEPIKQLLLGLSASHDISKSFPDVRYARTEEERQKLLSAKHKNPPISHPLVRTHPVTGEKALFVNEGFTTHIDGLSRCESDALLDFLFKHSTQPKYAVRWHWRNGDVAIWDNRITQHLANFDYGDVHRVMHRATIIGDKPY